MSVSKFDGTFDKDQGEERWSTLKSGSESGCSARVWGSRLGTTRIAGIQKRKYGSPGAPAESRALTCVSRREEILCPEREAGWDPALGCRLAAAPASLLWEGEHLGPHPHFCGDGSIVFSEACVHLNEMDSLN